MKYERAIKAADVHPVVERLTKTRLAWKMNRVDLASRMGCTVKTLARFENGDGEPTFRILRNWADALGYDLNLWPRV
jgi:transcriptional regulator with XRE-family HTH domain